jgi:predicted TIM-barrel fold metal-dependent hydrolase
MPFAGAFGDTVTGQTISAIESMEISEAERKQIFAGNARRLLHFTD